MLLALLATAEESHATEEVTNPILPVVPEIVWGVISFTALFLLVNSVLLPAAKRAMNDREATIRADLDAAEAARARAATAFSEVEDHLAGARAEAAAIIEQARTEAETERQRLVARAEREVAAMREVAESDVRGEREQALAAMQPEVIALARATASRLLNDREIDAQTAATVVDRHMTNPN
jgi:F-type H+-transporting ATPase subunit b